MLPLQALSVSHSDQFRIENTTLFADVASTSHALYGDFIKPVVAKSGGATGEMGANQTSAFAVP